MKRVVLWILAVLLFLLGAASLAGAGWVFAVFGPNGAVHTEVGTISCPDGRAIVLDLAGVTTSIPDMARLGVTTLDVASAKPVFVGASERTNVDPLLVGQSYCVANRNGADWGVVAIPGQDAQPFSSAMWRTAEIGTSVAVPIGVNDPITVLVVNDDGSKNVTAKLSVTFTSESLRPTMIGAAIAGVVLVIVAVALAIWAMFIGKRKRAAATSDPEPTGKHAGEPKDEGEAAETSESTTE